MRNSASNLSKTAAKILIVDDDADVRSAVRMTLGSEPGVKYTFEEANDVTTALRAFKSSKPDVIILDIHLPGKDGFDFMNILKENRLLSLAKIIILTADDSFKNLWKAESKGVDAFYFMGKPFESDALRALVLNLVLI